MELTLGGRKVLGGDVASPSLVSLWYYNFDKFLTYKYKQVSNIL
jgi:hypothetical protein